MDSPRPTSRPARTAIALVLGLLLGLGVLLLAERLDNRLHDVGAVSAAFGLPVIAEVPKVSTKKAERRILSSQDPCRRWPSRTGRCVRRWC